MKNHINYDYNWAQKMLGMWANYFAAIIGAGTWGIIAIFFIERK